jgi:hypothetical protein
MWIKGKDHKAVFILGAGATRGAIKHVLINNRRIKPPLNGDFFQIARTYAKARGDNSEDANRVERLDSIFKEIIPIRGDPDMEQAFSLLYVAKDFPEIYSAARGRRRQAGAHKEIEDFLRLTFSILTEIDYLAPKKNGYVRLVKTLGPTDALISLNYDTALDSTLVRYGWDPRAGYCLGGGRRKVEWTSSPATTNLNIKGVCLLKLHGSTNWYVRGGYSELSRVFTSKPVFVGKPRRNEKAMHIRQIVPPIYGKFFEHDHWKQLWNRAFTALCSADTIIIIGCSLADSDFHLLALISRVVSNRKRYSNPFRTAILVAGTKTRRKWQKVLKGSYKNLIAHANLEHFLKKEMRV